IPALRCTVLIVRTAPGRRRGPAGTCATCVALQANRNRPICGSFVQTGGSCSPPDGPEHRLSCLGCAIGALVGALLLLATTAGANSPAQPTVGTTGIPSVLPVVGVSPYSAQITWPAVPGAATVEVYNGSTLIDEFPTSSNDSYTVRELLPASSYTVTVKLLSGSGTSVGSFTGTTVTLPQTSAFPRLYAGSAFINKPGSGSPSLDASSSGMVSNALVAHQGSANFADSNAWGIPIVSADTQSRSYSVGCLYYFCNVAFAPVHIPTLAQPNAGSDGHLAVLQPDGSEMDMWLGQNTASGWTSGERWLE